MSDLVDAMKHYISVYPDAPPAITMGKAITEIETLRADNHAMEEIAEMLRDPEWGVGMLEDIADIVRRTGREVEDIMECDWCGERLHQEGGDGDWLSPDGHTLCWPDGDRLHEAVAQSTWARH